MVSKVEKKKSKLWIDDV